MNDEPANLDRLLQAAELFGDWAAQAVVALDLAPRQQNLRRVTDAIAGLYAVRKKLYAARPELRPAAPRAAEPDAELYGPDNPVPPAIRQWLALDGAVRLFECLRGCPNPVLAELATRELPALAAERDRVADELAPNPPR